MGPPWRQEFFVPFGSVFDIFQPYWENLEKQGYAGACAIKSLNSVTNAPSFGPGLLRSGLARSTRTSGASVPSTLIVSSMNSARGIARGSLLLPSRSVCTHGGAISSTLTDVSFRLYRCESAKECSAAFVAEYTAVSARGTYAKTEVL